MGKTKGRAGLLGGGNTRQPGTITSTEAYPRKFRSEGKRPEPLSEPRKGRPSGLGLLYVAESEDLALRVPVKAVGVVDEVPQQLAVFRRGHN